MVDGGEFWISCKLLKTLRKLVNDNWLNVQGHLQSVGINVTSEYQDFAKTFLWFTKLLAPSRTVNDVFMLWDF